MPFGCSRDGLAADCRCADTLSDDFDLDDGSVDVSVPDAMPDDDYRVISKSLGILCPREAPGLTRI